MAGAIHNACEGAPAMCVPFLPGRRPWLLPLLSFRRTPRTPGRRSRWLPLLLVVLAGLPCLAAPQRPHAQQASQVQIRVEPRIVGRAHSQVPLAIEIGPAEALPKKGFVSLRGLPPNVALTAGQLIATGSWTVSISDLATLKADIPAGLSGQTDILISLISLDGRMLAQAKTMLVVEPSAVPPSSPEGARVDAAPAERTEPRVAAPTSPAPQVEMKPPPRAAAQAARPVGLSAAEKERAERALAQGEQYLARGSIVVARQYFQLAADAGLAAAALRLATTYDPAELQRLEVSGVIPDRDLARRWYERARELGALEADAPLARLSGR
jgi:hypothetical protein